GSVVAAIPAEDEIERRAWNVAQRRVVGIAKRTDHRQVLARAGVGGAGVPVDVPKGGERPVGPRGEEIRDAGHALSWPTGSRRGAEPLAVEPAVRRLVVPVGEEALLRIDRVRQLVERKVVAEIELAAAGHR